jgi:arylformamidase
VPARGEHVFLDYTQAELDRAYDQSAWAPDGAETITRYASESERVRARYEHHTFAYGRTPEATLDVFLCARRNAPIHVFVHGGAWQVLSKDDSSFLAPVFVDAGAHFVALDFALVPQATLPQMVAQLRRAIGWIYRNARRRFGGNPGRIYLSGHSSGGHLVGTLVTTDWKRHGLPATVLKGAVLGSGMYDLRPVLLSARGNYLPLHAREEDALSPQRHVSRVRCPTVVVYGSEESPEFKRQSRCFAAALQTRPQATRLIVLPDTDHFSVPFVLGRPGSVLAEAALAQMRL